MCRGDEQAHRADEGCAECSKERSSVFCVQCEQQFCGECCNKIHARVSDGLSDGS
jgi:hypothetical protein